jgi:hypothetical protein
VSKDMWRKVNMYVWVRTFSRAPVSRKLACIGEESGTASGLLEKDMSRYAV